MYTPIHEIPLVTKDMKKGTRVSCVKTHIRFFCRPARLCRSNNVVCLLQSLVLTRLLTMIQLIWKTTTGTDVHCTTTVRPVDQLLNLYFYFSFLTSLTAKSNSWNV